MQRRSLIILSSILGGGILVVLAIVAYILRPTAAPSGEITAVPLELSTPEIISNSAEPTDDGSEDSENEEVISGPIIFELAQAESEVRFTIKEILRGEPTTVVGRTNQLAA